ncbi:putative peptidase [Cladorrhinum samala]|uniref:Peptidase n=1 Tax=Cladorrhinum samala TaxID=585594 RepID=A0AAV9HGC5_9PEZI|nr:putative peptidase [Cladorrhinum samala]
MSSPQDSASSPSRPAEPPADAVPIFLNGQVQDPHDEYAKDAKNTNFIIITVNKTPSADQEVDLERLSVKFLEDLGDNHFLCYYEPSDLSPLRELNFVRQVDVYRNKCKLPAALPPSAMMFSAASFETIERTVSYSMMASTPLMTPHRVEQMTVDIFTHETVDDSGFESLKDVIAEASGVDVDEMEFAPGQVRLCVDVDKLAAVAKDDRIRIIEEVREPTLMSLKTYEMKSAEPTGPPPPIAASTTQLYRGKGQIVTVTDTGFDTGDRDNCHPAFTGRVHSLRAIARKGKADDPHGHGTHVSGILLGTQFNTTKGPVGGIAPEAHLIVQSLYLKPEKYFSLPLTLLPLLAGPYEDGSRIFSNSWGIGFDSRYNAQPPYSAMAGAVDDFIRNHPDVLVCFSAGNDNLFKGTPRGRPTMGLYAGAKNVLTVGATLGSMNKNPALPDQMNPMSSTGPTKEGRLKPDVVAPGTEIFAALSQNVAEFYGETATSHEVAPEVKWRSWSGTSQATPLVAGCGAILREVLQDYRGCTKPPGVLLKALIINGADRLPEVDTDAQGHGRVNLDASLAMIQHHTPALISKSIALAAANGASADPTTIAIPLSGGTLIGDVALKQDEAHEFIIPPPHPPPHPEIVSADSEQGSHFKITMVYNDIGKLQIQNNLNLSVTDLATGEETQGNRRSLDDPDQQNNVEQIVLSHVPLGGIKVRVHGQKIFFKQDQDYALAWSTFTPLPGVVY